MPSKLFYPYGEARLQAAIKTTPEDFIVTENLGFDPCGDGEHLFLFVEKVNLTTHELIDRIARSLQISQKQIGHSGLKDKHAISRQWLSLHLPGLENPQLPEITGCRLLRQIRNRSKLRPGTHRSNDFEICLREVSNWSDVSINQILRIQQSGMANYFGSQRFGSRRDNVEQALHRLGNRKTKRHQRGLLISALRSELFNQILSKRIKAGFWSTPLSGDVFMLRGSQSIFSEPLDERLLQRYQAGDISSCASLFGSGNRRFEGEAEELEQEVFAANRAVIECLKNQSAKLSMRATRVFPENLEYAFDANQNCLKLSVTLPTGSYLTTLLDHFATYQEPERR
ncbi:MAG: tRNA pseudouridine(13) synthase TruD [Pseudomonadota bacterium]